MPTSRLAPDPPRTWRAYLELTKPGITRLVVITTAVGFGLAALESTGAPLSLALTGLLCLIGTALCSSSANALNQVWEWRRDALMPRTCARPVPTERIAPRAALVFGLVCGVTGVALLTLTVTGAAGLAALATIVVYVLVYTPMKVVSTTSTIVGAIPGALPPVIGYAAVGGFPALATPAPWSLFAIMFLWQIPHFLAIAWMHRDGYARGGFRVLPLVDPDGRRTARASLGWLLALVPISLTPLLTMPDRAGWPYALAAIALGVFFIRPAIRFLRARDHATARGLFLASIAYLPLILLALVADAIRAVWLG